MSTSLNCLLKVLAINTLDFSAKFSIVVPASILIPIVLEMSIMQDFVGIIGKTVLNFKCVLSSFLSSESVQISCILEMFL